MAVIEFEAGTVDSKREHYALKDCMAGDIVYIELEQVFGIIGQTDNDEIAVTNLADGDTCWYSLNTPCWLFINEPLLFNIDDFVEFKD